MGALQPSRSHSINIENVEDHVVSPRNTCCGRLWSWLRRMEPKAYAAPIVVFAVGSIFANIFGNGNNKDFPAGMFGGVALLGCVIIYRSKDWITSIEVQEAGEMVAEKVKSFFEKGNEEHKEANEKLEGAVKQLQQFGEDKKMEKTAGRIKSMIEKMVEVGKTVINGFQDTFVKMQGVVEDNRKIIDKERELSSQRAAQIQHLSDRISDMERAPADLKASVEKLEKEIAELKKEKGEMAAKIKAMEEQTKQEEASVQKEAGILDKAGDRFADLNKDIARDAAEMERQEKELNAKIKESAELEKRLQAITAEALKIKGALSKEGWEALKSSEKMGQFEAWLKSRQAPAAAAAK